MTELRWRELQLILAIVALGQFSPATGQPILQASGGTVNSGTGPPGTALVLLLRTDSTQAGPVEFTLRGPSGWNNGVAYSRRFDRPPTGAYQYLLDRTTPATSGIYTLSAVVSGTELSTPFVVDASQLLPRPDVRVRVEGRGRIVLTWSAPVGAQSYIAFLYPLLGGRAAESDITRATMHVFERDFSPGPYNASVWAYNADLTQSAPNLPPQYNVSASRVAFALR